MRVAGSVAGPPKHFNFAQHLIELNAARRTKKIKRCLTIVEKQRNRNFVEKIHDDLTFDFNPALWLQV